MRLTERFLSGACTWPRPNRTRYPYVRFIRDALPKEGVNVLVMEFDYRYQFASHPEVADQDALSKADVQAVATAASDSGVRLVPLINLLGHQSWAQQTFGLLRAHPEFDETPGKYLNNQGIYCRSYCPLHPDVHKVVFDLIDELADACGADAVHVGMDEVFLIGTDDCPRCRGRNRAKLFAQEVRTLHDHLAEAHREMWMWGDRLLDGYVTGLGEWEASQNGTATAINDVPRNIVICDWHYESAPPTAAYFAVQGFRVLAAPWEKRDVALGSRSILISGGTGTGKTTLLNILASFIPNEQRLVIIEDTAEIQVRKDNLVRLEARREQNGLPAVSIRELLKATLRHRPDRIILGEICGGEAFDLLQLLNTGHSGTLSTVHATSAEQGLSRFTSCVLQSGIELPYRAIKSNIADSLNLIVQLERRPGKRFVSEVLEVRGYNPETDHYELDSLYALKEELCPQ